MTMTAENTENLLNNNLKDKILIVDDELSVVLGIKRGLRKQCAMEIDVAVGASQALQKIHQQGPYAVIISDLKMPEIDGIEFLSEVKRCWPDTMRILLTGESTSESTIEAINKAGVFRFLQKPYAIKKLQNIITQAVAEYKHRVEPKKFDQDLWTHFNNEMKDPLHCLMRFASTMKEETKAPPALHAYADYVSKSGSELVAMSEAAATLGAIDSGRRRLKRRKTCMKSMLRTSRKRFERDHENMSFEIEYASKIPDVRIDDSLFDIAVRALVEDAMQFRRDRSTIKIGVDFDEADDETLIVELVDTGPQFDAEQLRYFNISDAEMKMPFYRNRGVGLRLSLVKTIAELHDGSLELFDRDQQNFTTRLRLPNAAW